MRRINARLAPSGRKLKRPRSKKQLAAFGNYHMVDLVTGAVLATYVDLRRLLQELGLAP